MRILVGEQMKYVLEFEAPDDWKPMIESACWVNCPFSILTSLGHVCKAKQYYDKYGETICPVITKKVQNGTQL